MEDEFAMRVVRWITLLWPGLTDLWLFGGWWGLAIACSFAWLANLAIVSTFLWTDWFGAWSRAGVWVLLTVVWTMSVVLSFRQLRGNRGVLAQADSEDLFRRAQREYLHGNWVQAEQLLSQLTDNNANDAGARLMLVSLLRRTGQMAEAAAQLRRLEASDGAAAWQDDIARERTFLEKQLSDHQQGIESDSQTSQLDTTTVVDENTTNQAA
jgi:hypothetical protein